MAQRRMRIAVYVGTAILIGLAGCGISKQQKFRMSFLPTAPAVAALPDTAAPEPPALTPNQYLKEAPGFLIEQPELPPRPTHSDLLIRKAGDRFSQGRRQYQEGDREQARKDFDRAIDLMLEASDNPSDRPAFEARLEAMVDAISRYDLTGMGAAATVDEPGFEKAPLDDLLRMTFPVDPNIKNKVKEQLQATRSQLPLEINDTVLGYINYFSGRGRSTMIAGLERAGRYREMIERVFEEEGVPQELIHLAQAESGFLPRAVSRKKAAGMWQFLSWRGRQYGLLQTRYTDDRLDPEKATRAAAQHLRDLYAQFGDWYLAVAAYNCGPGNVAKAVERTGYADFWELCRRRVLPKETANYVPIILAMTIMAKNAAEYDLENLNLEPLLDYESVEITSPTHLGLIADLTQTPVAQLQALNPALLRSIAPAGCSLRVPKGTANSLVAALQLVPEERRALWRGESLARGRISRRSVLQRAALRKKSAHPVAKLPRKRAQAIRTTAANIRPLATLNP